MSDIQAVMTRVTRTEMVGEHLVRVSVAGEELRTLPWGESGPGPRADAYFKVVIPAPGRDHVRVDSSDLSRWRQEYLSRPETERGWIRTYTLRDARVVTTERGEVPEMDIDVVVHEDDVHGGLGPGARWGSQLVPADTVQLLVPSATGTWWACWDEHRAGNNHVVLAGDETAVPAAAAIVDCVDQAISLGKDSAPAPGAPQTLHVAVEVPSHGDATLPAGPAALSRGVMSNGDIRVTLDSGTELTWTWLERGESAARNEPLESWLRQQLEGRAATARHAASATGEEGDEDTGEFVWATADAAGHGPYWFLAAESSAVKSLRRMCVSHGVPKTDISFMGYWKRGRATE
ncbi:siderophore-interacting protein [Kocuria sp. cx-455]|uniref:siderophore-interacting protein n=1 Tax=Kocuria sp. cx-455 TaxID=2771377 RepID=UPI001688C50C|nr:siderophore-interacting protein [Kocuria sp. cx-455]MBD2764873.1 siderophore-interacting protein [Kocuria sp. cx-455]